MAALAGILNRGTTAAQAVAAKTATPAAVTGSATSSTSGTTSDSATISANDFLTLLVTEMQNQDPTADVDPNEYINQLVNVNSLEQLIQINQTLSSALPTTAPTSGTAGASSAQSTAQSTDATGGVAGVSAPSATFGSATTVPGAINAAVGQLAPGNLGVPAANPAAQRVAQSLSGQL